MPDWQHWKLRVSIYLQAAAFCTITVRQLDGKVHGWEGTSRFQTLFSWSINVVNNSKLLGLKLFLQTVGKKNIFQQENCCVIWHFCSASQIKVPVAKSLTSSPREAYGGGGQESNNPAWSSTLRLNIATWDVTVGFPSEKAFRAIHFCHILAIYIYYVYFSAGPINLHQVPYCSG